jgi:hypothetical protein
MQKNVKCESLKSGVSLCNVHSFTRRFMYIEGCVICSVHMFLNSLWMSWQAIQFDVRMEALIKYVFT